MAQTNRKRRRKHRGTQAGTIETRGRTGRGSTRTPSGGGTRGGGRQQRPNRFDKPPTLRGSLVRAALAAAVVGILIGATDKQPVKGLAAGVFVLIIYVPMTYYLDRTFYRRRQRKKLGGG